MNASLVTSNSLSANCENLVKIGQAFFLDIWHNMSIIAQSFCSVVAKILIFPFLNSEVTGPNVHQIFTQYRGFIATLNVHI